MAALGAYMFSVAAVSILCGMVNSLLQGCSVQKYAKFLCGMILFAAVLRPFASCDALKKLEIPEIRFPKESTVISESIHRSYKDMADIIKRNTQTYIEDKAAGLGLEIRAEVTLSEDALPVPLSVTLKGSASAYSKLRLEEILQEDLNIAKENLLWTG